jgi:hypothetical protein
VTAVAALTERARSARKVHILAAIVATRLLVGINFYVARLIGDGIPGQLFGVYL